MIKNKQIMKKNHINNNKLKSIGKIKIKIIKNGDDGIKINEKNNKNK